jgi:malate dehydrogenase
VRSWALGTPPGDWVSMGVPSDGSYGVAEGVVASSPCTCSDGRYEIVQGLEIDDFSQSRIDTSVSELVTERDMVARLGLV